MSDDVYESEQAVVERTVLGCLTGFCNQLKEYIPQLSEDDFAVCPGAFSILRSCYDSGNMSMQMILAKFADAKKLRFITDCASCVATVLEFEPALKRLRELSMQRRLEAGVSRLIVDKALNVHNLRRLIDDESAHAGFQSEEAACEKALDVYLDNLGKPRDGLKTGFASIDKATKGMRKQTLCYIGARPSTGKTSFALNIAHAQKDKRVLLFSLEMSVEAIFNRYAASSMLIPYEKFEECTLTEEEKGAVKEYLRAVRDEKRLFIIDDIFGIEAITNAVMNIRPDVVIIDYLQKITTTKNISDVRIRTDYISGELKRLAKFADCNVICLSQLSRNGTECPRMSDLKESGALEADGDYIFLLHRPFVVSKDEEKDAPEDCDVLLDKNKFGRTGIVKMHFAIEYQRFYEKRAIKKTEKLGGGQVGTDP